MLYVRPDLEGGELPVSVTLGRDGTVMLTEQLPALPAEHYRVERYLIADPGDVDDDCVDDITELAYPAGMNPLNPAHSVRPVDGAVAIPGTAQVGETLTADTSAIEDADGLEDVSYSYQWIAGGTDIDGATDSTYTLADADEGKTIKVKVSFTDDADNDETLTSEATEAVAAAPAPLTVSVTVSAPASHDGSSGFTFDIEFSEEFGLSYVTLKFHAFNVTGGSVEKAQRKNKPSNISWRITVAPDSTGDDVVIELPATTDCDAQGAICTGDGRKLSNSLNFTVSGPDP